MSERPYTLLSCAVSLDGYLDDASGTRLVLSGAADLDRVDEVRSRCDAILVGAGTLRRDDPRLLVRSPARRAARGARGLAGSPQRVVLTASGALDPSARLFHGGPAPLVYAATGTVPGLRSRLGGRAEVVPAGQPVALAVVLADLAARGTGTLLVEGGGATLAGFLATDLADELHLAVAPLFVADPAAPRLAGAGTAGWPPGRRARLVAAAPVGDMAVLRYALSGRFDGRFDGAAGPAAGPAVGATVDPVDGTADRRWLAQAVELSRSCPPATTAYAVGAVVVGADGRELARGYSRDAGPRRHAEESALARVPAGVDLSGATLYSSLEPCSTRRSGPRSCTELILSAGLGRVVYALREPPVLADCQGTRLLREAGVEVVELPEFAGPVRAVNAPVLGPPPAG